MKKLFIFIVPLLFMGCATIFHGSTETVNFNSEPQKASIYVNGENLGKTPCPIVLKANKTYTIEFRLDGYETKTYVLNNSTNAAYIVLDVVFGLIPVIIDASTGDWATFDNNDVKVILDKK